MIRWYSGYQLGINFIDRQHRRIVDILNELIMFDGRDEESVMRDIYARLMSYVENHFKDEEEMMKVIDYPGYAEHKAQHDEFFHRISGFRRDFLTGHPPAPVMVFGEVWNWFAQHIMKTDAQYKPVALEKGIR
jgi:hemerythrin